VNRSSEQLSNGQLRLGHNRSFPLLRRTDELDVAGIGLESDRDPVNVSLPVVGKRNFRWS
jgi:hypothetical protein